MITIKFEIPISVWLEYEENYTALINTNKNDNNILEITYDNRIIQINRDDLKIIIAQLEEWEKNKQPKEKSAS